LACSLSSSLTSPFPCLCIVLLCARAGAESVLREALTEMELAYVAASEGEGGDEGGMHGAPPASVAGDGGDMQQQQQQGQYHLQYVQYLIALIADLLNSIAPSKHLEL
jgi:hypothetical protein